MDTRIGRRTDNGTQWPETDVNGQPYTQPATTVGLDEQQFVVIPVNFTDWRLIEELRKPAKKRRGSDEG